ncbi:MAG TPA: hypothetical protein PLW94_01195 [Candidatus Absconditabacterales bacterium]|nr:hypothetical protein [Candidatus Absconditabacterales bacterium]
MGNINDSNIVDDKNELGKLESTLDDGSFNNKENILQVEQNAQKSIAGVLANSFTRAQLENSKDFFERIEQTKEMLKEYGATKDIQNLDIIAYELQGLEKMFNLKFYMGDLDFFSQQLTLEGIKNLKETFPKLQKILGEVTNNSLPRLSVLTKNDIDFIFENKSLIEQNLFEINIGNITQLKGVTKVELIKIGEIKSDLMKLVDIDVAETEFNISELAQKADAIKKVAEIEADLKKLDVNVTLDNISELAQKADAIKKVAEISDTVAFFKIKPTLENVLEIAEKAKGLLKFRKAITGIDSTIKAMPLEGVLTLNFVKLSDIIADNPHFLKLMPTFASDKRAEIYKKITDIYDYIKEFGFQIDTNWMMQLLSRLTLDELKKVKSMRSDIESLGINITIFNIKELAQGSPVGFKKLLPYKEISRKYCYEDAVLASQLIGNSDIKVIKDLLERKKRYLENNRVLSDEAFDALFKPGHEFETGKYGYGEIQQKNLGYCYAYSGFNLLKNSNFFDVLVKTSLKETGGGREVKVPLGSKNGTTIKISNTEINDSYFVLNMDTGEYKSYEARTTSETTIGMRVLEIAFIKKYILEHQYLNDKRAKNEEAKNRYSQAIQDAKKSFEQTGDFQLNSELLGALEGGFTSDWFRYMLGEKVVMNEKIYEAEAKDRLFTFINNGLLNVNIIVSEKTGRKNEIYINEKGGARINVLTLKGEKEPIALSHAYSLERTYTDSESGEKVAVIANPWNTHKKILLKRDDAMTLFDNRELAYINPNELFRE